MGHWMALKSDTAPTGSESAKLGGAKTASASGSRRRRIAKRRTKVLMGHLLVGLEAARSQTSNCTKGKPLGALFVVPLNGLSLVCAALGLQQLSPAEMLL